MTVLNWKILLPSRRCVCSGVASNGVSRITRLFVAIRRRGLVRYSLNSTAASVVGSVFASEKIIWLPKSLVMLKRSSKGR